MKQALFICSANYYRSRFAEHLFNWLAPQVDHRPNDDLFRRIHCWSRYRGNSIVSVRPDRHAAGILRRRIKTSSMSWRTRNP
jgi:protein-tyrosine-phosphatase